MSCSRRRNIFICCTSYMIGMTCWLYFSFYLIIMSPLSFMKLTNFWILIAICKCWWIKICVTQCCFKISDNCSASIEILKFWIINAHYSTYSIEFNKGVEFISKIFECWVLKELWKLMYGDWNRLRCCKLSWWTF